RERHLAEIAREIVPGERLPRARAGKRLRHQMRADRMLHAGTEPADNERPQQHHETDTRPGDQVADPGERRAEAEDQRAAETLRDGAGRYLKPGHRADIERAEQTDFGIAQP